MSLVANAGFGVTSLALTGIVGLDLLEGKYVEVAVGLIQLGVIEYVRRARELARVESERYTDRAVTEAVKAAHTELREELRTVKEEMRCQQERLFQLQSKRSP